MHLLPFLAAITLGIHGFTISGDGKASAMFDEMPDGSGVFTVAFHAVNFPEPVEVSITYGGKAETVIWKPTPDEQLLTYPGDGWKIYRASGEIVVRCGDLVAVFDGDKIKEPIR